VSSVPRSEAVGGRPPRESPAAGEFWTFAFEAPDREFCFVAEARLVRARGQAAVRYGTLHGKEGSWGKPEVSPTLRSD